MMSKFAVPAKNRYEKHEQSTQENRLGTTLRTHTADSNSANLKKTTLCKEMTGHTVKLLTHNRNITSKSTVTTDKENLKAGDKALTRKPLSSAMSSVCVADSNTNKDKKTGKSNASCGKVRSSIAASYLGKTADGLAVSPRKSQNFDAAKSDSRHVTFMKTTAKESVGKSTPSRTAVKKVMPTTPEKSIIKSTLERNRGVASPTVAKIPSDIVRNRVKNIQNPHVSTKASADSNQIKHVSQIRKSLAGVFEQRKSGIKKRKSCLLIGQDDDDNPAEDFSVTVAVRVRPFSQRELDLSATQVVFMNGNETVVTDGVAEHSFVYDHSLWSFDKAHGEFASQRTVYERVAQPLLYAAFEGYNTCLFAYGQTGSGKSYTIMGLGEDKGVVPRFCDEMFACIQSKEKVDHNVRYHVQVSYFEIYNEKIHDLLVSTSSSADGDVKKQVLKVREHPEFGPYVEGLSKFIVASYEDVLAWLEVGNRQRATASTGMNDKSSRSHSVFTMSLVQTTTEDLEGEQHESGRRSLINLVDLAGSERSSTAGTSGQRLKEGASINKSLLTLGKVIWSLSERSGMNQKRRKPVFVPYRDSALTWILKESLGGNSRTAMVATISPANCHMEETLSTLRYARQARSIVNLVKVNEDPNARIIRELKSEIAKLKAAYGQNEVDPEEFKASLQEVSALRKQLRDAEKEKDEVQEAWMKKLELSEKRKVEEINELKRAGVSFKVDNQLPNLVNLNEDPQLSELLLYMIKHGVTRVGKKGCECDIQLSGALIADLHCKITNIDEVVTIEPIGETKTFVNGELITKAEVLHHGDRVIIGGDHFFRLNNPIEVERDGKKRNSAGKRKDFEFAKHELIDRQNERLQREIEEAQLKVKTAMLGEIEAAKHEAEQLISSQRTEFQREIQNLQAQLKRDQDAKRELETICEKAEVDHRRLKDSRKNRNFSASGEQQLQMSFDDMKSQVVASLEQERQKLAREMERMQKRVAQSKAEVTTHTAIPLRLSIILQEANNISKSLNKHTTFSRHDASDDQSNVMIKVHNTQLGIWTLWTMEKFEEKLELMRELYDRGGEASSDSSDDGIEVADLFYDPNDEWQESYSNNNTDLPTPSRNHRKSSRLTRRLSSLVLARASPALQESLTRLNAEYSPRSRQTLSDTSHTVSFCKRALNDAINNANDGFDSLIDKLLLSLHELATLSIKIAEASNTKDDYSSSSAFNEDSLAATMSSQMLLAAVGFIKHNSAKFTEASPSLCKLLNQIEKSSKDLIGNVTMLLHGCHSGIEQIVSESSAKITRLAPNISKYSGAITVATNLSVSLFNEDRQHKLSHRLKHAFLQGGDTFMRKVIAGGIDRLSQVGKENLAVDKTGNIGSLSGAALTLLQACMDLQADIQAEVMREILNRTIGEDTQELYDASMIVRERSVPSHYYSEYLQRTQSLIREISALVDGVAQLNMSTFGSVRYKAESLWRPTSRIADLCVKHEGLCAIMHDVKAFKQSTSSNMNSNNNNSLDESSLIPSDRLCDNVFAATRSMQEMLRQIIECADSANVGDESSEELSFTRLKERDNTISERKPTRRKRILPTSPPLLNANDFSTTSAVKNTIERWLQFADGPTAVAEDSRTSLNDTIYV